MAPPRIIIKIVLDIACLLSASIPIALFRFAAKPFIRGYYCDDESIRYPYKDSTITTAVLCIVGLGLPILSILIVEYGNFNYLKSKNRQPSTKSIGNKEIHPYLWHSYARIGVFIFGAAINVFATDIAKYTIGRPRPHFITVCNPPIKEPCNHTYIEDYTCQNNDADLIRESRLSFPSGHSSLAAYCMIYLVVYLQVRLTWKGSVLLKPFLQFLALSLAFYTSLSRISDYKHHWSDVLSGFALGTVVAILITIFTSDLVRSYKKTPVDTESHVIIPMPDFSNDVNTESNIIPMPYFNNKATDNEQPYAVTPKSNTPSVPTPPNVNIQPHVKNSI